MNADAVRTYSVDEERLLTEHLGELSSWVHRGKTRDRLLDVSLLRALHETLFQAVRSHAGRIRAPGFGAEYLTFGPHHSAHRNVVEPKLKTLFGEVQRRRQNVLERVSESHDEEALHLAVYAHAEIIWIHPFEDGNGRTSRLCASHLLVQLGLHPVSIETMKQEYLDALNHYFTRRDLGPLVDLYVRLYPT